ncbi:hypothetical protein [Nocardia mexicana]|uniref:Uncharacterized protein n=1 Tax=Nocardia mexicana TaxID=279262 RepID=A0A370HEH7_9NOCA|nr:hypothetical protein [Nocardia mexicana]RDI55196.1 hypothetical protein DFR68_10128 [Nocardia mexicana]
MMIRYAPLCVIALTVLLAALALIAALPAVLLCALMGAAGVVLLLFAMRTDDRPAPRVHGRWS